MSGERTAGAWKEYARASRDHWDEVVPIHAASDYYDVVGFREGKTALHQLELEELGDVIAGLIDAGLRIEFPHEFPFTVEQFFPFTEVVGDRKVRLTKHDGSIPLLFSIRARKPRSRPETG